MSAALIEELRTLCDSSCDPYVVDLLERTMRVLAGGRQEESLLEQYAGKLGIPLPVLQSADRTAYTASKKHLVRTAMRNDRLTWRQIADAFGSTAGCISQTHLAYAQRMPCPICGEPMSYAAWRRGGECRTCYKKLHLFKNKKEAPADARRKAVPHPHKRGAGAQG